jgi:lysophospholipase L1-like esterase
MRVRRVSLTLATAVAVLISFAPGVAAQPVGSPDWFAAWATAQHQPGPTLTDQTIRTIVHLSQGGRQLRVRLGNTVGTEPITVAASTVAIRVEGARVDPATLRSLTFNRSTSVTIPAGGHVVSDPATLTTKPRDDLAVSTYIPGPASPSQHAEAFDTSYLTEPASRDRTTAPDGHAFTRTISSYPLVTAVDVHNPEIEGTIVVVGGSVTDGTGSRKSGTMGTGPGAPPNSRWSDVLARRIVAEFPGEPQFSVANAGIGGNTAAKACASSFFGPMNNVEDRYDRDVLSLSGVHTVIVYAGTNDIGNSCPAETITAALRALVDRAHAKGVRVVIATITPRLTYTPAQNAERALVNTWITRQNRCGGECDGIAPFDTAIAWYANPNAIDPAFDSGDTIHPNAEGYARMGNTIDLRLLQPR